MKKIISALALGAIVFGAASADTKININYRNGTNLYKYVKTGDGADSTKQVFNQTGYNGGKDTVSIAASGDVFSTKWNLQPTVGSNTIVFNQMELAAKFGSLQLLGGWWRDGNSNGAIRVKNDVDAGNWEGSYFEGFKPGSMFKNRPTTFLPDMTNMSISDTLVTGLVKYTLSTDAAKFTFTGSVMSDRAAQKLKNTDGSPDNVELCDGSYGWGANINVAIPEVGDIEALVKANNKWGASGTSAKDADGNYVGAYAIGAYFMPKMITGVSAAIGGGVGLIDNKVSEYSVDLRARWVNGPLAITTFNNVSFLKKNANGATLTTDGELSNSLGCTTLKGKAAMWNLVSGRYKINSTITAGCTVAEVTVLKAEADTNKNGTTIRVTPFAQLYANGGSSILVGASVGYAGIGKKDVASIGEDKDLYFEIPVLFRVKM